MTGDCPRKEKDRPKPTAKEPDPIVWHKFALLADKLGFDSKAIRKLKAEDPYESVSRASLLNHNPPGLYTYDEAFFEASIKQMAQTLGSAVEKNPQSIKPPLMVDGPGESLQRRRGRVFEKAYELSRDSLFLKVLHNANEDKREGIGPVFVRRSVFFAFFGGQRPGGNINDAPEPPLPTPPASEPSNQNPTVDETLHDSSPPDFQRLPEDDTPVGTSSTAREPEHTSPAGGIPSPTEDQTVPVSEQSQATTERHANERMKENADPKRQMAEHPPRRIYFRVYKTGGLEDQNRSLPYDPSEVERVSTKYVRKGYHLMTTRGRGLTPERCFDAVTADGTYTIVLVPSQEEDINRYQIVSGNGSVAENERGQTYPQKRRHIARS